MPRQWVRDADLPRCVLCGDPLRWHPGNGGQWLGALPGRDWMHCHGSAADDAPRHRAPLAALDELAPDPLEAAAQMLDGLAAGARAYNEDEAARGYTESARAVRTFASLHEEKP